MELHSKIILTFICALFFVFSSFSQENITKPQTVVLKSLVDASEDAQESDDKKKKKGFFAKMKEKKQRKLAAKKAVKAKTNVEVPVANISTGDNNTSTGRVLSYLIGRKNGDLCLKQEMIIYAPLKKVWDINVTPEGWMKWVCEKAEFELEIGDTIKSHYNKDGVIGDSATNYIIIDSYVPNETITFKAILGTAWPEFMVQDKDRFSNLLVFESLGENTTKLTSYGIGYRNNNDYIGILDYIDFMNKQAYEKMIKILESE